MTRHTPRWGLFLAFDVLLDVGLVLALLGFTVGQYHARSVSGTGYGAAATVFTVGTSLLVRGAIAPLMFGDRGIRKLPAAPKSRHRRRGAR